MKNINEMSRSELTAEIQYIVSLFGDEAQMIHSAAYLADLTEALAAMVNSNPEEA